MQPWHTLVVWAGSAGDRLHLRATIPHSVGLRAGALASPRWPHRHGMPLEQVCNRLRAQRWARVSPLRKQVHPTATHQASSHLETNQIPRDRTDSSRGSDERDATFLSAPGTGMGVSGSRDLGNQKWQE